MSARVDALDWDAAAGVFRVTYGGAHTVAARAVVLGVGTVPTVPECLRTLLGDRVFHTADYLTRRPGLDGLRDVTVIGSGQSGAEVLLDLLRRPTAPDARVRWLTRSPAFAPMEYSKLGLEQFTPDYIRYFRALPASARDRLVPAQWQLYKAISADTIAEIHDLLYDRDLGGAPPALLMPNVEVAAARFVDRHVDLICRQVEQDAGFAFATDAVVLGTGYAARRPALLDPMAHLVDWDERGRYRVAADYRVALRPGVAGRLYVQNAELHTHGVGAPDLGLAAYRAAAILNSLTGRTAYRLPRRAAYTTFGVPGPDVTTVPLAEDSRVAAGTA
jgi:lysine N6-hydroxylase